jgi:hypothetical protein
MKISLDEIRQMIKEIKAKRYEVLLATPQKNMKDTKETNEP